MKNQLAEMRFTSLCPQKCAIIKYSAGSTKIWNIETFGLNIYMLDIKFERPIQLWFSGAILPRECMMQFSLA